MSKELKIRVPDVQALRAKLAELGATELRSVDVTDTYFEAPEGVVLKLSEVDGIHKWIQLHEENGGFVLDAMTPVEDLEAFVAEKKSQHRVKRVLAKVQTFFDLNGQAMNLNEIEEVGDFLILEGNDLDPNYFSTVLGISQPEFIEVPFSDL